MGKAGTKTCGTEGSLKAEERSRIARRAARARWFRRADGVLTLAQIRAAVKKALAGREARALLFGSYATGEMTRHSITRCRLT